jgi:LemA protein
MNKKAFQGREILHFSGAKDLSINTESLSSLPTLQPQNVATHSPMQQYQGQPQYVQGQPQYIQQGQPQYVQQGQPQYVQQGQPQYVQQGQPQYVQQGQPQYVQQGQPQYVQQGQPPMVPAVVVAPATGNNIIVDNCLFFALL